MWVIRSYAKCHDVHLEHVLLVVPEFFTVLIYRNYLPNCLYMSACGVRVCVLWATGQSPGTLMNIKLAGEWTFIPPSMVCR